MSKRLVEYKACINCDSADITLEYERNEETGFLKSYWFCKSCSKRTTPVRRVDLEGKGKFSVIGEFCNLSGGFNEIDDWFDGAD